MTDPEQLTFGIETSTRSKRLTIEGPSVKMLPALAIHFEGAYKVGGARIFELEDVDDARLRWKLNAKAIGRLGEVSSRTACDRTNQFIKSLVSQTLHGNLSPDPLLDLKAYTPAWDGWEFNFGAELQRSATPSYQVEPLVRDVVLGVARDLSLYRPHTSLENYERLISTTVDLEGDGVSISLGVHSSIHTMCKDWKPGAERFELWENNAENGAEPLVYLAGAVAIAHADELV